MKAIFAGFACLASAQMTMQGQSGASSFGQYATYPQAAAYQGQQTFGQQPSQLGSFTLGQGNTQVNAQVGQFKVPSQQQFSLPAGYQVAPQQQYSQYAAPQQQYTAPTQQYSQYQTQVAPQQQQVRSASLGAAPQQMGLPQGYAPAPQYSQYSQQYPSQQYGMPSGMGMAGAGMGASSGAPGSTQTVQTGVRTMYVPIGQVQNVLASNPGARMVGTVTADRIPAGAAFY